MSIRRWPAGLLVCLATLWGTAAGAQLLGPEGETARQTAKQALSAALQTLDQNTRLPRTAAYEIGVLQAQLGDLDGGVATILAVPDALGTSGPRWQALAQLSESVAVRGKLDAVQAMADRQKGVDRAAALCGLARARFKLGDVLQGTLTAVDLGDTYPDLAARLLANQAAALAAVGAKPPTDLLARALELAGKIPAAQREPDGGSTQASILATLMRLHAEAGNDAAALSAALAIKDADDRQTPLLELVELQVKAGRFAAAFDTAQKLSPEQADPTTAASTQVSALCAISLGQQGAGDADGALQTAKAAADSARQTVASYVRVRSLLAASEAVSKAGDGRAGTNLTAEALVVLLNNNDQKALALLSAGRAQMVGGSESLATQTFSAARQVVAVCQDPATLLAAVTVPASIGRLDDATSALALFKTGSDEQRQARVALSRTLAQAGRRADAMAAARAIGLLKAEDRHAQVQALCAIVETKSAPDDADLLGEALGLTLDPFDLAGIRAVAAAAGSAGLPSVALAAYRAAVTGAAKVAPAGAAAEARGVLDAVVVAVGTGLAAGQNAGEVVTACEQSLEAVAEPEARAAAFALLAQTFGRVNEAASASRLLSDARSATDKLADPVRRSMVLSELGAVAFEAELTGLSQACFDTAEAVLSETDWVSPAAVLALAETEAPCGRTTARRLLLRSVMSVRDFRHDGADDLARLARVADYVGQPADALAIARRVADDTKRVEAYLDLARVLAGQPVKPLRSGGYFRLPATVDASAEG